MSSKQYALAPDGIFWTLQGEGAMRGQPMVFIRLAGCSIGCPGCDTNYSVAKRMSVDEILNATLSLWRSKQLQLPADRMPYWVWITGGEPSDHDLEPLISGLRSIQLAVAVATSGVRAMTGLDISWLSVSPHSIGKWVQRSGTELKLIPKLNGLDLEQAASIEARFAYRYVQPMDGDPGSLEACKRFVLTHPDWSLTDQGHKLWKLP